MSLDAAYVVVTKGGLDLLVVGQGGRGAGGSFHRGFTDRLDAVAGSLAITQLDLCMGEMTRFDLVTTLFAVECFLLL